ncbi:MAG: hypothetical protein ACRBI6_05390 [Acidimicrobiales bacterium]
MVDIPAIARAIVGGIATVGPILCAVGVAYVSAALLGPRPRRARYALARRGFDPEGHLIPLDRGVVLATAAIVSLAVSFAIEEEVRVGPNRAIDQLLPEGAETWVLQHGTDHFMNNSAIDPASAEQVLAQLSDMGEGAVLVSGTLASVTVGEDRVTGFVFALPTSQNPVPRRGHTCESESDQPCLLPRSGAIVDAGEGVGIGDSISVRGVPLEVVAHPERPRSLLNRLVVYVDHEAFARIEPGSRYFAIATTAPVAELGPLPAGLEALSTDELRQRNEAFWAGNGTPLLLLLILLVMTFASTALYGALRTDYDRHRRLLSTLWALGQTRTEMLDTFLLRSLHLTALAAPPAAALSWILMAASSATILGFNGRITLLHLLGATGSVIACSLATISALAVATRNATPAAHL